MKTLTLVIALVLALAALAQPAAAHPGTHCHQHDRAKKC